MRKFLGYFLLAILIIGVGYLSINIFVKSKLSSALKDLSEKEEFSYDQFNFNVLNPKISLETVSFIQNESRYDVKEVLIEDLGYYEYVVNKKIKIGKITLNDPKINLVKKTEDEDSDSEKKESSDFDEVIQIGDISIKNANLKLIENEITTLEMSNYDIDFQEIKVDAEILNRKIPFEYGNYSISGGKLTYLMSQLQTLTLENLQIDKDQAEIHQLKILPNYSREEYIKVIPHEMDLMDLEIENITLNNYKLQLDSIHDRISVPLMEIENADFKIYRDKTIADDTNEKKLYSQMLRDLSIGINIDTLDLINTYLSYEEVQEKTGETGKVYFTNLSMQATSLTNFDLKREDFPTTEVHINSQFMGEANLDVEWTFRVNDPQDNFTIKGKGSNIPPEKLNLFFKPAFNMNAEGENISDLYFDFYGNKKIAQGEFFMVYDDLKIEVLKKDEEERNKFVSFFANLLVKKKNEAEKNEPVEVSDVERDPTRSFWNYFWNCIFAGLKKTLI